MNKARWTFLWLALSQTLLLAGCGGIDKYNPFTESKPEERSTKPANSTEYQCEGGKHFYVRMLDKDNAAWLIYPDREVNLDKVSGTRYSNGIAELDLSGYEATLTDGANAYRNCKAVGGK